MLGGVKIIESLAMVDQIEDWSKVRSPGRARRRRHKHRQNIKIVNVPKKHAISIDGGRTLIVHPEAARLLRDAIKEQSFARDIEPITERWPSEPADRIICANNPNGARAWFSWPIVNMADVT